MKIRKGLVSNSSSSSFCIYGCEIEKEEVYAMVKAENMDKYEEIAKDNGCTVEDIIDSYLTDDVMEEFIYGGEYDYDVYLGERWDCIKDDETGAQFKRRVEEKVEKRMGRKIECMTIKRTYYS